MLTKKQLSPKEIAPLLESWHFFFSKKDHAELLDEKVILINHKPLFFYHNGKLVPTLQYVMEYPDALKKITVDMGAVKFVVSGADIMRPGIVSIESEISSGDVVLVVDVQHKKPLAVGVALFSSSDMQQMTVGKVIKNIHWVGDGIWKAGQQKL